jgi:hypothetical protein
MSSEDAAWLASAVTTWSKASELLDRRVETFPHAVVYDETCAWHLNPPATSEVGALVRRPTLTFQGTRVPMRAIQHGNAIALPNGQTIDANPLAYTSMSEAKTTFFVMALPSQWKKHPGVMPGEDIGAFARGVFAHEITHTVHLAPIAETFDAMGERYELPKRLHDDYLQEVFEKDPEYVDAYEREEALLWESIRTEDDARAREPALEALKLAEERRAKYFIGANAFFLEAEPIFLNLEGVASWVASSAGEKAGDPEEQIGGFWSQRHGLALFLLIDRFDPEWKKTVFADEVPSPYETLRGALN